MDRVLASLDVSSGGGTLALDIFYLLIVLAMIVGGVRIARRLSAWRIERRMGGKRATGGSERIKTLRKLARLRDSGALSEEEFETAKARVLEE